MATALRDTSKYVGWLSHYGVVRQNGIEALCEYYEPLVRSMAQRYRQSAEVEEMEQVARLALVEACISFDPKRWKRRKDGLGRLFSQHAVWCIRHALSEYVRSLPNPVRLPSVLANRLPKMRRETVRLAHELGREPTREEIAEAAGPHQYQNRAEAIALMLAYDDGLPVSFDIENGERIRSPLPTPEEIVIAKEELKALRRQRRTG